MKGCSSSQTQVHVSNLKEFIIFPHQPSVTRKSETGGGTQGRKRFQKKKGGREERKKEKGKRNKERRKRNGIEQNIDRLVGEL